MSDLSEEQKAALLALAKEHNLLPDPAPGDSPSKRPELRLPTDDRELHDFARELGALAAATGQLFRRDRAAVLVNEEKKRIDEMSPETFRTWISEFVACYYNKKVIVGTGDEAETVLVKKIKTMPLGVASGVVASLQFWRQLPEIKRLNATRLPTVREDGRIELLRPGYFAEQGVYTLDDGLHYDDSMSFEVAKEIIDDIWSEFPFPNKRSKAVAIAAQLTMFCRSMLPKGALVPATVYHGNSVGAGKTLGAKVAVIPVCGSVAPTTFPRKEDEAKKVLDTIAIMAKSYVLFDNIRGKIQSTPIETFITSAECTGRILGQSQDFTVENVTTVFMTGNQCDPGKDIKERALFVELFVQQADNRDRHIKRVINDSFLAAKSMREKILSALWTFVKAYDAAGRPAPASIFQRFEQWSATVAAITTFAGYGDPVEVPEIPGQRDEVDDMHSLIEAHVPSAESESESTELEFEQLMATVKSAGLFEDIGGYRDKDLYVDGKLTRTGQSLFGKLFSRFDRRLFAIEDRTFRFFVIGRGDSRRFVIADERSEQFPAV